jgi:hypothetical protein
VVLFFSNALRFQSRTVERPRQKISKGYLKKMAASTAAIFFYLNGSGYFTVNSTRRFCALPSGVGLILANTVLSFVTVVMRSGSTPAATR